MFDFILYLGESALCLVALYIIYKAAMSHDTLHTLNRVTMLSMVVLSAVLPLCHITIIKEVSAIPAISDVATEAVVAAEQTLAVDYLALAKSALCLIFLLGVAVMVVRLILSWLSVERIVRSGQQSTMADGVTLSVVENISSPFSWFRYVVLSKADMAENRELILEHELAHVRLHHSWDVLFVDLVLCLWWFNPAMWLLRRDLQNLHEYQADDAVLSRGVDAKTYQLLLIKRAVGSRLHSVANCLNHSNLKNRITMMCKNQSSRWSAAKLLLVLPMVAISLAATATTVYVETKSDDKVIEKNVKNQTVSADVDVAKTSEPQKKKTVEMPEKMPTFQGGDLNKFVLWLQTNVKYPAEAVAKSIQGRVIFSFVVNKDGSVGSFEALKSPDKSLTDEVERVFNTSPKWEPAEQDGKKVNVKFTVPIIFKMEE